jgi:hypothetical protein
MKIKITKDLKVRLLKAIIANDLDSDNFPELFEVASKSLKLLTDEELDAEIKEFDRKWRLMTDDLKLSKGI